jgi:hypothetical protein
VDRQHGKRRGITGLGFESTAGRPASTAPRGASSEEPRWRVLLSSIRALQMELKRCAPERTIGLSGNPAAPESAIVVAELRLGRRLPPSYREFLAFSDGWPRFFENADLLGTGEIGRVPMGASQERAMAGGRLLPFGADRAGTSFFAFDTRVRPGDGELPVVAWVGGLGLDCRCFTSFLATVLQLCRAELATAKSGDMASGVAPSGTVDGLISNVSGFGRVG